MVPRVGEVVLVEDLPLGVDEEEAGHDPRIADRGADAVPFAGGAGAAGENGRAEHLAQATAFDAKRAIKIFRHVGDGTRLRPQLAEESFPPFDVSLVKEDDRGVVSQLVAGFPQVRYGFAAEQSTEVAEKDEERRPL